MAGRRQYTFTFTNAQPGAIVSFDTADSDHLYADATSATRLGYPLILDANKSITVWSDATVLTAKTEDGEGNDITATATANNSSVTSADGVAPTNPAIGSGGSGAVPTAKTSAYTAASGDAVLADASGGDFAVTLPAPALAAKVTVKNVGATGTVTVDPHAAETIDGAASYPIPTQWMSRDFLSDGTNWLVV